MTEIIMYNSFDLAIMLFELVFAMIVFAIVKGWYDNRKWEKHIYQVVEQYRAKYGVDESCEMLLYKELQE
ncbi:hypothetical protein [uncultured Methanobrevibacter sp.]|uniref:hypothetical protein n=1 Tax=uncultured Methanobrevibacter sp. TaxID=253161 RepID=UPI0025D12221|nr:hypothetical protein [uncultured Methanobrevibacter sp.]